MRPGYGGSDGTDRLTHQPPSGWVIQSTVAPMLAARSRIARIP